MALVYAYFKVTSIAFSPDSRRVISGCDDGRLRWWNANSVDEADSREHKPALSAPCSIRSGPVLPRHCLPRCAAFSPDGRWILSGDSLGNVIFWDSGNGRLRWERTFDGYVSAVAFGSSGDKAAICVGNEYESVLWQCDVSGENCREFARLPLADISLLDLRRKVIAGYDRRDDPSRDARMHLASGVIEYEPSNPRVLKSPCGNWRLVLADDDKHAQLHEMIAGAKPYEIDLSVGSNDRFVVSIEAKLLAVYTMNGLVSIWDLRTPRLLSRWSYADADCNVYDTWCRFVPGTDLLVTSVKFQGVPRTVLRLDSSRSATHVRSLDIDSPDRVGRWFEFLALSYDGKRIVLCGEDDALRVYEIADDVLNKHFLDRHADSISSSAKVECFCEHCHKSLSAHPKHLGRRARCPRCKRVTKLSTEGRAAYDEVSRTPKAPDGQAGRSEKDAQTADSPNSPLVLRFRVPSKSKAIELSARIRSTSAIDSRLLAVADVLSPDSIAQLKLPPTAKIVAHQDADGVECTVAFVGNDDVLRQLFQTVTDCQGALIALPSKLNLASNVLSLAQEFGWTPKREDDNSQRRTR